MLQLLSASPCINSLLLLYPRMLNETNTSKKSSLKSLVDCFPKERGENVIPSGVQNGAKMMVVPPLVGGHSLTHEQVMPFLKKLEHGQQREGEEFSLLLVPVLCYIFSRFSCRCFESLTRPGGNFTALC